LPVSLALVFVAYGGWGVCDRIRTRSTLRNRFVESALTVVCALLAAAGIFAGAGVIYSVWAIALGTWIS
jgi:hypothetical protein